MKTPTLGARTVAALLVLAVSLFAGRARAAVQDAVQDAAPVGHWEGEIANIGLAFDVDLVRTDGVLGGDLSIPAQNLRDAELLHLSFDGTTLRFEIAGVPGEPTFEGVLDEAAGRVAGSFTQGGNSLEFWMELRASTSVQAAERLGEFDEWAAAELRRFRVPGMSVAVVWRGEIVFAEGFGLRDAAADLPVTADTLFAIGSTTKAFTTFAIAQAVEEGLLDWDEPVRTYLPEFRLFDEYAQEHIALRDMCSHRSGLPRHDLAWYLRPQATRAELVLSLAHLEPNVGFRETWQYNNFMFLTAGYALGRVTGTTWEERVRTRVLEPLGMLRTAFGPTEALTRDDVAMAHDRIKGKNVVIPFRDLASIGPAGSIHSSANDMARWMRMLLARGEVDGTPLLSPGAMQQLVTPVTVMSDFPTGGDAGPTAYALGWMIDTVQGELRVHHGGGIDGFTTQVELYPAHELGIFVVTDRASALTTIAAAQLAERMLDLEPRDRAALAAAQMDQMEGVADAQAQAALAERIPDAPHARALSAYVGEFAHPGYGTIAIEARGEGLTLVYGSATVPLEHWHFEVFSVGESEGGEALEGLKVHFVPDTSGHVVELVVPLEPAVAPIRFALQPDQRLADPALLQRLTGSYALPGAAMSVSIVAERLALSVPGQGTFALVPATHGRYSSPELDGYFVRFDLGESGPATAMILIQPNGVFRAERSASSDD